jgi:hypothetical protein
MENNRKIKTIITRINHICDIENKSLSKSLEKYNLTPEKYLKLIGLTIDIDKDSKTIINKLMSDLTARIYFNPNMESLENDSIEISSKTNNQSIIFTNNELRIYEEKVSEDDTLYYEEISVKIISKDTNTSYTLNKVIEKKELETRIISKKYYIKHMHIKVAFKINGYSNAFEFTINNDMLASDLDYALRLLNNQKIKEAYIIFKKYPSDIKIIDESHNLV